MTDYDECQELAYIFLNISVMLNEKNIGHKGTEYKISNKIKWEVIKREDVNFLLLLCGPPEYRKSYRPEWCKIQRVWRQTNYQLYDSEQRKKKKTCQMKSPREHVENERRKAKEKIAETQWTKRETLEEEEDVHFVEWKSGTWARINTHLKYGAFRMLRMAVVKGLLVWVFLAVHHFDTRHPVINCVSHVKKEDFEKIFKAKKALYLRAWTTIPFDESAL